MGGQESGDCRSAATAAYAEDKESFNLRCEVDRESFFNHGWDLVVPIQLVGVVEEFQREVNHHTQRCES